MTFQTQIEDRTATIGVVGLGYVGLPLALAYAGGGFKTVGFDIDEAINDIEKSPGRCSFASN